MMLPSEFHSLIIIVLLLCCTEAVHKQHASRISFHCASGKYSAAIPVQKSRHTIPRLLCTDRTSDDMIEVNRTTASLHSRIDQQHIIAPTVSSKALLFGGYDLDHLWGQCGVTINADALSAALIPSEPVAIESIGENAKGKKVVAVTKKFTFTIDPADFEKLLGNGTAVVMRRADDQGRELQVDSSFIEALQKAEHDGAKYRMNLPAEDFRALVFSSEDINGDDIEASHSGDVLMLKNSQRKKERPSVPFDAEKEKEFQEMLSSRQQYEEEGWLIGEEESKISSQQPQTKEIRKLLIKKWKELEDDVLLSIQLFNSVIISALISIRNDLRRILSSELIATAITVLAFSCFLLLSQAVGRIVVPQLSKFERFSRQSFLAFASLFSIRLHGRRVAYRRRLIGVIVSILLMPSKDCATLMWSTRQERIAEMVLHGPSEALQRQMKLLRRTYKHSCLMLWSDINFILRPWRFSSKALTTAERRHYWGRQLLWLLFACAAAGLRRHWALK